MSLEENKNLTAAVEALLFVYGEPMELKKIARILKAGEVEIRAAIEELARNFEGGNRGLKLLVSDDKVQLATKPEFSSILESFVKEEFKENLTPVSLETISLISYLGPLSRSQIEYYRGVNSSFILRTLLMRGLVERYPDPEKSGVYLYRASFDLLRYLGLSKVEDLPEYDKYHNAAGRITAGDEEKK